MDKGLEKENRQNNEISHGFDKNNKMRNYDVEWNIEKIVQKAFKTCKYLSIMVCGNIFLYPGTSTG